MATCIKKAILLCAIILFTNAFTVFAQGQKITDKKDDTIFFDTSHEGNSTTDTGIYIPSKRVSLNLMNYGEHYTFEEIVDPNTKDKITKLIFTKKGEQFIKDNIKVVEFTTRYHAQNVTESIKEYSVEEYEQEKGVKLTEILNTILLQFAELTGRQRLEENTGYRQFQNVLNEIYFKIKNYLRECYSLFAFGTENHISDNLQIQEALSTNSDSTLTSDVNNRDKTAGRNYLKWILFSLLSLELILVAVSSFVKGTFPATEVVKKFLICLLILFFITNIWTITDFASKVFIKGGNIAGRYNGGESYTELKPGDVMEGFFRANAEINRADDLLRNSSTTYNLSKVSFFDFRGTILWLLFLILKLVLFVIYTITALYVLLWHVELYLLVIVATFLLPFYVFRYTNFLTKGIPQTLLGQCVKVFTATLVVRLFSGLFSSVFDKLAEIAAASEWSLTSMLCCYLPGVIITSMVICYFTLKVPETARAILSGTPTTDGNIHGMATRMATKAITLPVALSTSNARKLATSGTTLYGASIAHMNGPGTHAGRAYAFTHGGIATGLTYNLGKKFVRAMGAHNTTGGKEKAMQSKPSVGIGTDPSTPDLTPETIIKMGEK